VCERERESLTFMNSKRKFVDSSINSHTNLSSNNNIPRIHQCLAKLRKNYGKLLLSVDGFEVHGESDSYF